MANLTDSVNTKDEKRTPGRPYSGGSVLVAFRIPQADFDILQRRMEKTIGYFSVNTYVKDRVLYDLRRKHGK